MNLNEIAIKCEYVLNVQTSPTVINPKRINRIQPRCFLAACDCVGLNLKFVWIREVIDLSTSTVQQVDWC